MALIKYSPIIGAISGTIGSITFAASSKRPIARTAQRLTAQDSARRLTARARFDYVSALWTSQTAATRAAWQTLATQLRYTDALGQPRPISGRQFFISHNLELLQAGQTLNTSTLPLPYDTKFLDPPGLVITGATTANYYSYSTLGPLAFGMSLYVQVFHRDMTAYYPAFGQQPVRPIPNRWTFCKWNLCTSGGATNLYPAAAAIIGNLELNQWAAVRGRFVQSGYFSQWQQVALAKRTV